MISDSAFDRLQNIRYIYLEGFSSSITVKLATLKPIRSDYMSESDSNSDYSSQLDLSSKFENLNQKIIKLKLSIHLGFWESLMIRPITFREYLSKIIQSHATVIFKNWVFMSGNSLIFANWIGRMLQSAIKFSKWNSKRPSGSLHDILEADEVSCMWPQEHHGKTLSTLNYDTLTCVESESLPSSRNR